MLSPERPNTDVDVDDSPSAIPLTAALDALVMACTKLRLVVWREDAELRAAMIQASVQALRLDLVQLRKTADEVERGVLAEEMAMFAESVASTASQLGGADDSSIEERAAVDVAFHSTRLAHALRGLSPVMSTAVH